MSNFILTKLASSSLMTPTDTMLIIVSSLPSPSTSPIAPARIKLQFLKIFLNQLQFENVIKHEFQMKLIEWYQFYFQKALLDISLFSFSVSYLALYFNFQIDMMWQSSSARIKYTKNVLVVRDLVMRESSRDKDKDTRWTTNWMTWTMHMTYVSCHPPPGLFRRNQQSFRKHGLNINRKKTKVMRITEQKLCRSKYV